MSFVFTKSCCHDTKGEANASQITRPRVKESTFVSNNVFFLGNRRVIASDRDVAVDLENDKECYLIYANEKPPGLDSSAIGPIGIQPQILQRSRISAPLMGLRYLNRLPFTIAVDLGRSSGNYRFRTWMIAVRTTEQRRTF